MASILLSLSQQKKFLKKVLHLNRRCLLRIMDNSKIETHYIPNEKDWKRQQNVEQLNRLSPQSRRQFLLKQRSEKSIIGAYFNCTKKQEDAISEERKFVFEITGESFLFNVIQLQIENDTLLLPLTFHEPNGEIVSKNYYVNEQEMVGAVKVLQKEFFKDFIMDKIICKLNAIIGRPGYYNFMRNSRDVIFQVERYINSGYTEEQILSQMIEIML